MKILVTGSEGFIGKHVVDLAKRRGHEVHCIDWDLEEPNKIIRSSAIYSSYEAVIHLAARIDIADSFRHPVAYMHSNLLPMDSLMKAKRVVFASSAAVYGEYSPYGAMKRLAEDMLPANSISLRLFNPFGPGEHHKPETHIVPILARNSNEGKVTSLYHNGEQTRDFIHINDVAIAFVMAAESDATGTYDLCGTPLTIKKVADIMKVPYELVGDSRDAGDTLQLVGNPKPLEEAIGFTAKKDVKEMLKGWRYWY